ncbi:hypothetical protein BJ508DRAFT_211541 [Ascobolus immersus RN42]|uniref:L domain-like protein n=1 Tax=Ascobolus immersus RN42 TaxID=1160509 RepID=A0A3N4I0Q6_ASCIM|nr:hypothetical protein BJ508DRAFT_211541 [Ascobolus immersus RN42]
MDSEDGVIFIKRLTHYVKTHEKGLANALQLQQTKKQNNQQPLRRAETLPASSPASSLYAARHGNNSNQSNNFFSGGFLNSLGLSNQQIKPAKLTLTPHHLFYLLSRFEDLNIGVGPMGVRLENINSDARPDYLSFLSAAQRNKRHNRSSDSISIRSVSSVRSVISNVGTLWSNLGIAPTHSRGDKAKAALEADLKYLYSAFTKIPYLCLTDVDNKTKLIEHFEEFPFDTAVPLVAFKNLHALEIADLDIRKFYGWDQLAERLRSLTVRRGGIEDPAELIIAIVLDDMDKRRRRSAKQQTSPSRSNPPSPQQEPVKLSGSAPSSQPMSRGPSNSSQSSNHGNQGVAYRSHSPRPSTGSRNLTAGSHHTHGHGHGRTHVHNPTTTRMKRSGSGSSHSSATSTIQAPDFSSSTYNLPSFGQLPSSKWRFLKQLCLADNSLTTISAESLMPLSSLVSLDLSQNLFVSIPEALKSLPELKALNMSNNMISSLHSLLRAPLPAITSINLRGNRLSSLAGIERLLSLERIDLRENRLTDPQELARLTGVPNIREIYVSPNPFTKAYYQNYRITIFNLFRKTAGYTEDILLDGSLPGMVERRYLVERAAEPPAIPAIKPTPAPEPQHPPVTNITTIPTAKPPTRDFSQSLTSPVEKVIHHHATTSQSKRRKAPRRRIVELTPPSPAQNLPQSSYFPESSTSSKPVSRPKPQRASTTDRRPTPRKTPTSQTLPTHQLAKSPPINPLTPPFRPVDANTPEILSDSEGDWEERGEDYKRRIEALRNDVGQGWLSVLSEEGWDRGRKVPIGTGRGEGVVTGR